MSVTIKDVARRANVSVATVSRALNGHQNVADEVRKRVLSVADQMRYSPHHAARSLSSRRTQTIGVVLPDLYGEFFSELVRGIDQVAREQGLHLLVSSYHGHPQEQGAALRAMRGRVDGLLLMSPFVDDMDSLAGDLPSSMPTVLMNTALADSDRPSIGVDNQWNRLLAEDYRAMSFHISLLEALGRRLRRTYGWIFTALLICYLAKILVHPTPLASFAGLWERAALGPLPGAFVLGFGLVFHSSWIAVALLTLRSQKAVGLPQRRRGPDSLIEVAGKTRQP